MHLTNRFTNADKGVMTKAHFLNGAENVSVKQYDY